MRRVFRSILLIALSFTLTFCFIFCENINFINPSLIDAKAENAVKVASIYYGTYNNLSQAVENGEISIDYEVGDTFQFGTYPQTIVTDKTTEAELNSLYPFSKSTWTDYGYYGKEVDNEYAEITKLEYMYYIDVTLDSVRYRGVIFDHYRTDSLKTVYNTTGDGSSQKLNEYKIDNVYWFKYEPVVWRILDSNSGLVMSNKIIDSQPFNNSFHYDNSTGKFYLGSSGNLSVLDYSKCSLRAWLNDNFYNMVFSSSEQAKVVPTFLKLKDESDNNYENVTDNIFLLSQTDLIKDLYGFATALNTEDSNRKLSGTDYAKSQGLYYKSGNVYTYWITRPYGDADDLFSVNYKGKISSSSSCSFYHNSAGIVPAFSTDKLKTLVFDSQNSAKIYLYDGVNSNEYGIIYGSEGDTLPEINAPVRDGYTFKGWEWSTSDKNAPESLTGESITATAIWEEDDSLGLTANLTIGTDLTLTVSANKSAFASDISLAKIVFERTSSDSDNVSKTVYATEGENADKYYFVYDGIYSQYMADNISMTVYDGETVLKQKNITVKSYCESLKSSNAESFGYTDDKFNKMTAFTESMLNFGAAAQNYANYNTGNLAGTVDSANNITVPENASCKNTSNNTDANDKIVSATCYIDNTVKLLFKVKITKGNKIVIVPNDNESNAKTFNVSELTKNGDYYTVMSDDICATEFDTKYTVKVMNGDSVISSVDYSVNSYCYAKQNSTTANMATLAKTMYDYGTAADAYNSAE